MTLTHGGPAGNRLVSVLDEAPANLIEYGFKPRQPDPSHGALQYQYDFNGNMTYDPHKLLDITYNHLNLPERVSKGSTDILTTVYDAAGRKWKKTSTVDVLDEFNQPTGTIPKSKGFRNLNHLRFEYILARSGLAMPKPLRERYTYTETRVYAIGVEFSGEGTAASRIANINASADGRVAYSYDAASGAPNGSRVEYYHTDHLGNVRLGFSDLDGDGAITVGDIYDPTNEITQERHYYPFGLTHTGAWFASVAPEDHQ